MKKALKKLGTLLGGTASLIVTGSVMASCSEKADSKVVGEKYNYEELECCGDENSENFNTCIKQYRKANSCNFNSNDIDRPGDYCEDCSDMYGMPATYAALSRDEKIGEGGY